MRTEGIDLPSASLSCQQNATSDVCYSHQTSLQKTVEKMDLAHGVPDDPGTSFGHDSLHGDQ